MECEGANNADSENASLEECRAMAEDGEYMTFAWNWDKNKCYGVTEDTAAGCANPVEEESGKWSFFEFWCSEGYTSGELCEADKQSKKEACDTENVAEDVGNLDDCLQMALDADLVMFSYNKKTDDCFLPIEDGDGGVAACTDRAVGGNANKKSKIYSSECTMVEWISKDYYCDANDYLQITMVAEETKCDDVSTSEGVELTIAECNDFAFEEGMDWFAYRDDMGLCWVPGNAAKDRSCRNTGLSSGKAWDVYAACGLLPEQLSDEEMACQDKVGCSGEDCMVMWTDVEQSWKCSGATQDHKDQHFQVCVDLAIDNNKMWMNYRTANGACAVEDECVPVQSGSEWQILLNCDAVFQQ